MKNKKIVSLFIAVLILIGIIPNIDVSAATLTNKEKVFINAVLNGESSLNLSGYKITTNELLNIEQKLFYLYPETHHYYYNCNYNYSGNYVTKITSFNYKNGYTKSSIKTSKAKIEEALSSVLSGVNSSWNEAQKALYFHDWICVNFKYDMDFYANRSLANYTIYELLTEGKGVCQSYAFLYKYLLDRVGIENYYVLSVEDDHSWNVVKINGKWHHVDVTHDDPCIALNSNVKIDFKGKAYHDFFLLSNAQINNGNHDNWYNPLGIQTTCVDYTGGELWVNADSAIVYENGYWYYLDYEVGGLVRTSDFYNYTYLASLEKKWYKGGNQNSWYYGYYSGIGAFNGRIFYSDSYRIYSYDIKNDTVDYIAGLSTLANGSLFGFTMTGKSMKILITKDIRNNYTAGNFIEEEYVICSDGHGDFAAWRVLGSGQVYDCSLCGAVFDFTDEISGDANGDGTVNTLDLAVLKLALAGVSGCRALVDMDKNGVVDTVDLANLKLKLAGL